MLLTPTRSCTGSDGSIKATVSTNGSLTNADGVGALHQIAAARRTVQKSRARHPLVSSLAQLPFPVVATSAPLSLRPPRPRRRRRLRPRSSCAFSARRLRRPNQRSPVSRRLRLKVTVRCLPASSRARPTRPRSTCLFQDEGAACAFRLSRRRPAPLQWRLFLAWLAIRFRACGAALVGTPCIALGLTMCVVRCLAGVAITLAVAALTGLAITSAVAPAIAAAVALPRPRRRSPCPR